VIEAKPLSDIVLRRPMNHRSAQLFGGMQVILEHRRSEAK
jgi:hypothetical protein